MRLDAQMPMGGQCLSRTWYDWSSLQCPLSLFMSTANNSLSTTTNITQVLSEPCDVILKAPSYAVSSSGQSCLCLSPPPSVGLNHFCTHWAVAVVAISMSQFTPLSNVSVDLEACQRALAQLRSYHVREGWHQGLQNIQNDM